MLDFVLWREKVPDPGNPWATKEIIRYSYYEKDMANLKVMNQGFAIPHKMMIASMTQECVRRLHNTSQEVSDKDKCAILAGS